VARHPLQRATRPLSAATAKWPPPFLGAPDPPWTRWRPYLGVLTPSWSPAGGSSSVIKQGSHTRRG